MSTMTATSILFGRKPWELDPEATPTTPALRAEQFTASSLCASAQHTLDQDDDVIIALFLALMFLAVVTVLGMLYQNNKELNRMKKELDDVAHAENEWVLLEKEYKLLGKTIGELEESRKVVLTQMNGMVTDKKKDLRHMESVLAENNQGLGLVQDRGNEGGGEGETVSGSEDGGEDGSEESSEVGIENGMMEVIGEFREESSEESDEESGEDNIQSIESSEVGSEVTRFFGLS